MVLWIEMNRLPIFENSQVMQATCQGKMELKVIKGEKITNDTSNFECEVRPTGKVKKRNR